MAMPRTASVFDGSGIGIVDGEKETPPRPIPVPSRDPPALRVSHRPVERERESESGSPLDRASEPVLERVERVERALAPSTSSTPILQPVVSNAPTMAAAPAARVTDAPAAPFSRSVQDPHAVSEQRAAIASLPITTSTTRDTIRVHIGRVDVRAVFPSAPAASPRAATPTPSVTRDQFLGRKGGR
ncbi:MAG TPA: hypothetical protein VGC41_27115 [Kofleriaceae bacterium]